MNTAALGVLEENFSIEPVQIMVKLPVKLIISEDLIFSYCLEFASFQQQRGWGEAVTPRFRVLGVSFD